MHRASTPNASFLQRLRATLTLNTVGIDEIASNNSAKQAGIVALAAMSASAIGAPRQDWWIGPIVAIPLWMLFAKIMALLADFLDSGAEPRLDSFERILRTSGFAYAPGILAVFQGLGPLGDAVNILGGTWALLTLLTSITVSFRVAQGRGCLIMFLTGLIPVILIVLFIVALAGFIG